MSFSHQTFPDETDNNICHHYTNLKFMSSAVNEKCFQQTEDALKYNFT